MSQQTESRKQTAFANAQAIHGKAIAFPVRLRTDSETDPGIEWFEDADGKRVDPYTVMLALNAAYLLPPGTPAQSRSLPLEPNPADTPRTNALAKWQEHVTVDDYNRMVDHARLLERELSARSETGVQVPKGWRDVIKQARYGLGAAGGTGTPGAFNAQLEVNIGGPLLDFVEDRLSDLESTSNQDDRYQAPASSTPTETGANVTMSRLEAEILVREHDRLAQTSTQSDDFGGERFHLARAAELRRAYAVR